ncbi:MAG: hypothetical protein ACAI34_21570, partial [Verrucomicrobium sp.]
MRLFAAVFAISMISLNLPAYEVQVSPDGPVKSLEAARDAVRAWRTGEGKGKSEPVTVKIAAGTYPISQPVVFEPQDGGTKDSPVTYAGDGKVVISG